MGAYAAAAGIIMNLAGTAMEASVASDNKKIMSNLPKFDAVIPAEEQAAATKGNIANFNDASTLAGKTNTFNSDQLLAMMNKMVPGFSALQNQRTQLAADRMAGKISPDVANAVWSSSAGRALGLGIGGSGAGRNLTARDLGRTSLDLQDSGAKMTSDIFSSTPRPGLFDLGSMNLTPAQRISAAFTNNENLYSSAMQQAFGKTTPGATAVWANYLKSQGSQLTGAGIGSMGMGGDTTGAGAGAGPGGSANINSGQGGPMQGGRGGVGS